METAAPVNLFLQALFSQVHISLNDKVISSSTNNCPFRAYIDTLLNEADGAKKSYLGWEYFYKDKNLAIIDPLQKQLAETLYERITLNSL